MVKLTELPAPFQYTVRGESVVCLCHFEIRKKSAKTYFEYTKILFEFTQTLQKGMRLIMVLASSFLFLCLRI